MPSLRSLACLLVSALPTILAQTNTQTFKTCTTKFGAASKASVGSTTYGLTITVISTKKITTTPTITITPSSTSVVQQTVTVTSTYTTQVTTTPPAVVIPTVAGFTPVNGDSAVKRTPAFMRFEPREEVVERAAAGKVSQCTFGPKGPVRSPAIYPTTVTCAQLVKVAKTTTLTRTASATTTTLPVPVTTSVSTVVASTTTTIYVAAPTPTSYAACAANNFVLGVTFIGYTPPFPTDQVLDFTAASQVDCCIACQSRTDCIAGWFSDGICELYLSGGDITCDPTNSFANARVGPNGDQGWVVFNGECGRYTLVN